MSIFLCWCLVPLHYTCKPGRCQLYQRALMIQSHRFIISFPESICRSRKTSPKAPFIWRKLVSGRSRGSLHYPIFPGRANFSFIFGVTVVFMPGKVNFHVVYDQLSRIQCVYFVPFCRSGLLQILLSSPIRWRSFAGNVNLPYLHRR